MLEPRRSGSARWRHSGRAARRCHAAQDQSGLTQAGDWAAALRRRRRSLDPSFAPGFFHDGFDWVRVGDGKAFATGYYEPEIEGSRTPQPGLRSDLPHCRRTSSAAPSADGTTGRGRIDATGTCVLYFTRAEIEDGALAGKGLELAWAADPVDLFFLEIQGSGRVRFPTERVMRIGYADQNGRDYVAIGRLLRDRGILPPGGASMQAIKDWIRANPDQGRALMRENLSYIFFKELTGPGPLGALEVPVTPHGDRRRRSQFRAARARRSSSTVDRPEAERPVGCAGYRRRDQGAQPLRYLLGRGAGGSRDRRRHVGDGRGADPAAQGRRLPVRSLSPEEAELWARVAATIRPLSRDETIAETAADSTTEKPLGQSRPSAMLAPLRCPTPAADPNRRRRRSTAAGTGGLRSGAVEPDRVARPPRHEPRRARGARSTARSTRRSPRRPRRAA